MTDDACTPFYGSRKYKLEDEVIEVKRAAGRPPLNFAVRTYIGHEVYRMPDPTLGLTPRQLYDDRDWPRDSDGQPWFHVPITNKSGLKDGDRVIWKGSIHDFLYNEGVIVEHHHVLHVETPGGALFAALSFAEDDRKCWVSGAVCDARALARIDFT